MPCIENAPNFEQVAQEVNALLHGKLLNANNARFDYGFLKNEFKRLGMVINTQVLCTVKLSRALYPQHHRHNLDSLIERHQLTVKERHRALGDAQLIYQLCLGILGLYKIASGRPWFAYQLKRCRGACVGKESGLPHYAFTNRHE